ncbi:MAG: TolC family protein [Planctomycetota bacterium]
MRYLFATAVIVVVCGCRSPREAFHDHVSRASNWQVETSLTTVASPPSNHSSSIEELVDLGLAASPRLRRAMHKAQSLRCRVPQSLSLPDPMVNTTTHLSPVETAAGRQAFALGVSQVFVDGERRATKAAIAHDEARAAESEVERERQQLAEQIRRAGYQLLAVRETIQLTEEDLGSLAQIEDVVRRQYEVQQVVGQQDVLSVQAEQSRVEIQLSELRQREASLTARLARLLHLEPGSNLELTDSLETVVHQAEDVDFLVAQALHARPELRRQLARIQSDRRKVCLAVLQQRPDVTMGLQWIVTSSSGISPVADGTDALLLGVGFNLPIRKDRISAAKSEASHAALASMAQLEVLQDQIEEEVFDTCAKLESNAVTVSLLEQDLIPKFERVLDASLEEYAEGSLDFTQLIESWRSVLRFHVALIQSQSTGMQLRATLARQLGEFRPVSSTPHDSPREVANDGEASPLEDRGSATSLGMHSVPVCAAKTF